MHKLFTVTLLLCWLCVACCFIAPHVTWVPLPPGAGTCRNLCSKLTWAPVTLDGFENNQSEDLLCGRVVGARLLAGEWATCSALTLLLLPSHRPLSAPEYP